VRGLQQLDMEFELDLKTVLISFYGKNISIYLDFGAIISDCICILSTNLV